MANHIPAVEAVMKEQRLGFPNGVGELHRSLPDLLARIDELERALQPFARVALSDTFSGPDTMVQVYMKHCQNAWKQLDSKQGQQPTIKDFGLSAGR